MLRKPSLYQLVFALLIFFSCSDDDNESSASIVGKWEAVTVLRSDCPTPADNQTFQCSASTGTGVCYTVELRADKSFKVTRTQGGDLVGEGEYSMNGPGLSLNYTISNPYNLTSPEIYRTSVSATTLTTTVEADGSCDVVVTYKKIS